MKIDIDKLRAAHAATTQGEWEVAAKGDYDTDGIAIYRRNPAGLRVTVAGIRYQGTAPSMCAEPVAGFIALAHNEFPALLDEIERLRNAEKTEHDRRLAVETALVNLLCVINDDKDGGFFICAEAKDRIKDAQDVMGVAK